MSRSPIEKRTRAKPTCLAVAALACALFTSAAPAGDARRLCQPDANGDWHCTERAEPPPRQREGAPIPVVDARLKLPADNGLAVAEPAVGETVADEPVAGDRSTGRVAAAATEVPAFDPTLPPPRPRIRILAQPRTAWAIQIIATASREALERVAEQHQLYDHPAVRLASGRTVRYALIWDVYPDRGSAAAALASLPAHVKAMNPSLRPIGPLQDAMNEATRLNPPSPTGRD